MGDAEKTEEATPAAPPAALTYRPEAGGRVSVRGFRLLLTLTLLNTTLLGMSVLGPQLFPFLRQQWQQWRAERAKRQAEQASLQAVLAAERQCLSYSPAPDVLVYTEDPVEAAGLIRDGGAAFTRAANLRSDAPRGWVPPVRIVAPKFYGDYLGGLYPRASGAQGALLFLHERTTPGGAKHVVAVHFAVDTGFRNTHETVADGVFGIATYQQKRRTVTARAWPVGVAPKEARGVAKSREFRVGLPDSHERRVFGRSQEPEARPVGPIDYGNILRFFAGQPDPNDPTHFTIRYQIDGRDGVIDGWLKDDALKLEPREGTWKYDAGEWLELAAPEPIPSAPKPNRHDGC